MKIKYINFFLKKVYVSIFICLIFIFSILFSLSIGSSGVGWLELKKIIFGFCYDDFISNEIICYIRLPRVIMSGLVGATLSLGGLVFQVLLKNPLAEPYILGISGGSAIGAIFGILAGLTYFPGVTVSSFAGSMIIISLLILLNSKKFKFSKDSLLLTGVMVNAFCSSVIMFLIAITHDFRLHSIMFWLMGDFTIVSFKIVIRLSLILSICFIVLFVFSNWMNLLQLGDEMAHSMGLQVSVVRMLLFVIASIMVSIVVSHCGLIGFVGLVVPHVMRLIFSTDCRILVLGCILCGSSYLIICDTLSRVIIDGIEIPTGVFTSLVGAPIFIYLLLMRN